MNCWVHSLTKLARLSHRWDGRVHHVSGGRAPVTECGSILGPSGIAYTPEAVLPVCPRCETPIGERRVYFGESDEGFIKIGSSKQVARRVLQQRLTLLAHEPGDYAHERSIQARFADACIGGDWFRPTPALVNYIAALPDVAIKHEVAA